MSKPDERPTLDDVLDTYLASMEEPNLETAKEWGRRFPQHAEAIRDFVTSWRLAASLPADPRSAPIDAATFVQQGMLVVEGVFRREQEKDGSASLSLPIESLFAEARVRGLAPADLVTGLGMSIPLVAKLNRRLIDPASIPNELIEAVAQLLGRESEAITFYLEQPPTIAVGAFHRASGKPTIAGRENFFRAVRSDPAITDEHRARWLLLLPSEKPQP